VSRRPGAGRTAESLREKVRERYAQLAVGDVPGCCGPGLSLQRGYSSVELSDLPRGANLGLGCGSPARLASLRSGETVLDLGSGAGVDCFLASKKVGPSGRVIGVDMTAEMLAKARVHARAGRYRNVEFRLGEIEHLPVADASVDVVISNCVVSLAPDKGSVYREAYRVLRPGGRLAVSDVVATRPAAPRERNDAALWSSCCSGAARPSTIRALLKAAGFVDVSIDVVPATTPARDGPGCLGGVAADILARKAPG
jgi:arsenite methyltransferase